MKQINPYNSSGAIVIDPENDKMLQSITSRKKILVSEIDDCVDRGHISKRHELLEKYFELENQEKEIPSKNLPPKVDEKYKREFVDLSKLFHEQKIKTKPWWRFW